MTNHAIVAMIEEDVRQTRCTTCDTEHAYKGARVPKRRKKETPAALFKDVLAGMPDVDQPPVPDVAIQAPASPPVTVRAESGSASRAVDADVNEELQPHMPPDHRTADSHPAAESAAVPALAEPPPRPDTTGSGDDLEQPAAERVVDEPSVGDGPVHRRLIRATLPRPEGQKDTRPLPEFTVRQTPARNGGGPHFRGERMRGRGGQAAGHGEPNGNRAHGHHGRMHGGRSPAGGRQPPGRGGPSGFRGPKGGRRGRGSR